MGQRVAHARAHQQGRSYVTMVHANGEALNFELCSPTLPPPLFPLTTYTRFHSLLASNQATIVLPSSYLSLSLS